MKATTTFRNTPKAPIALAEVLKAGGLQGRDGDLDGLSAKPCYRQPIDNCIAELVEPMAGRVVHRRGGSPSCRVNAMFQLRAALRQQLARRVLEITRDQFAVSWAQTVVSQLGDVTDASLTA